MKSKIKCTFVNGVVTLATKDGGTNITVGKIPCILAQKSDGSKSPVPLFMVKTSESFEYCADMRTIRLFTLLELEDYLNKALQSISISDIPNFLNLINIIALY